jgi:hypothetical protein
VDLRAAREADLPTIVSLAHDMKRRLADWSPRYFHPHVDAEARHEVWLSYLVGSEDHDTRVITDGDEVVGFFNVVRQAPHWWVDDLVLSDDDLWVDAARLVATHVADPWVTCVCRADTVRSAALSASGLSPASTFWAVRLSARAEGATPQHNRELPQSRSAPPHVFGGSPFEPGAPGALVVIDDHDGYAIGSASMMPPLYDPGGPTTVIDQIVGTDRAELLDQAMSASAARGDTGVIVVCATDDDQLRQILERRGYRPEVDLFATLARAEAAHT